LGWFLKEDYIYKSSWVVVYQQIDTIAPTPDKPHDQPRKQQYPTEHATHRLLGNDSYGDKEKQQSKGDPLPYLEEQD
jgi:hypothetical protein